MPRDVVWEYSTITKRRQTRFEGRDLTAAMSLAVDSIKLEVEIELGDLRPEGWVADCDISGVSLLREGRFKFEIIGFRRRTVEVDQYCVPIKREICRS